MTARKYRKPPLMMRLVGNRMAPRFGGKVVSRLTVTGRTSGQPRTTPVSTIEHDGAEYLVAAFGDTDWSRNLRAAGSGELHQQGRTRRITTTEVAAADRPPILAAYRAAYDKMPNVASTFRALPDPADHPVFRITGTPDSPAS
ncbi:MAG TPA: nitroreductase family deazaflavin-dependent oxidoreductase [Mycobacteriales bacterium]|nr:nitroreductase family deazaflavin-dependent oxidoreductase [Mycobacteriales bacterium]